MTTTVELPDDRVYGECKTLISIDHQGHIPITFINLRTGDELVMVYLGKEEIEKIVRLYIDNHILIENEGEKKDDLPNTPVQESQVP